MRSSRVVSASDCQCPSRNSPGFDPGILRHRGIWGAADEAVLNKEFTKKILKIPLLTISDTGAFFCSFGILWKKNVYRLELSDPNCNFSNLRSLKNLGHDPDQDSTKSLDLDPINLDPHHWFLTTKKHSYNVAATIVPYEARKARLCYLCFRLT